MQLNHRKRERWTKPAAAESYIRKMGAYAIAREARIIDEFIGLGPGMLLDIPCGTGRNFEIALRHGFTVIGADFSAAMLKEASSQKKVFLIRADVFMPPLSTSVFDIILMHRILFHYNCPQRIISALLPSLKSGGKIIFDTLNKYSLRWLASLILDFFRRDEAHRTYYLRPSDVIKILSHCGLDVEKIKSAYVLPTRLYRFLPFPLIKVIDLIESLIPPSLRVINFWVVRQKKI